MKTHLIRFVTAVGVITVGCGGSDECGVLREGTSYEATVTSVSNEISDGLGDPRSCAVQAPVKMGETFRFRVADPACALKIEEVPWGRVLTSQSGDGERLGSISGPDGSDPVGYGTAQVDSDVCPAVTLGLHIPQEADHSESWLLAHESIITASCFCTTVFGVTLKRL